MKPLVISLAAALVAAVPASAQQVLPAPTPSQEAPPLNLDTDNDGEVSYLEYLAHPIKLFEQLDKDKSGALSKDEFKGHHFVAKAPEPAQN